MSYSGPEDNEIDAEEELGEKISSDEKSDNEENKDLGNEKKKKDDKIKIKKITTNPRPKLDAIR